VPPTTPSSELPESRIYLVGSVSEAFHFFAGHDERTETYTRRNGDVVHIIKPSAEPTGAHRAQTMDDLVHIEVTVQRLTEKAYLVETEDCENNTVEIWLPKSQVKETDCLAEGDEGYMDITRWIAKQKDLVDDDED